MDDLNPQMQNPNTIPPVMPQPPLGGSSPMGQMPSSIPAKMGSKKGSNLFLFVVAVILVVGGLLWWYVSQMAVEAPAVQQVQVDQEAREDTLLDRDIQETDLGNLDKEFEAVDKDINGL